MTELARISTALPSAESETTTTKVDRHARRVPGQPDMWVFVLFETLIFTAYFSVYLFNRAQRPDEFLAAQGHLDLRIGVLNTIVLLLSSWSIARCVSTARARAYKRALTNAYLTVILGAVFLATKVFEWSTEIGIGNGFTTSEFFSYYYFLTAIHGLHVIIGFFVVGVVIHQLRSPARRSQELVETGATYWHTVDFLWVLIFALLYVVR